eukprot:TRINITY_DN8624_c0_g1_i1.p1 TRINITY_DN8624_c0_g1~~TRINITY_DN8624_c0_g1_i1.p1  ORF type:complete len:632 (+),score=127.72 TRINITY_DN8624_c0_g1_i1:174-2069(+)
MQHTGGSLGHEMMQQDPYSAMYANSYRMNGPPMMGNSPSNPQVMHNVMGVGNPNMHHIVQQGGLPPSLLSNMSPNGSMNSPNQRSGNSSSIISNSSSPVVMSPQPPGLSILDYCQAIVNDYHFLVSQISSLKVENLQLKQKNDQLQEAYTQSQNMLAKSTADARIQAELSNNLTSYLSGILERLPSEAREEAASQLDRIKTPIPEEMRGNRQRGNISDDEGEIAKKKIKTVPQPPPKMVPVAGVHPSAQRSGSISGTTVIQHPIPSGRSNSLPVGLPYESQNYPNNQVRYMDTKEDYTDIKRDIKNDDSDEDRKETPDSKSPLEETSNVGIPKGAQMIATLPHGDVVCALSVHSNSGRIYTGGRGTVKVWDLNNLTNAMKPLTEIRLLGESYIRSAKVSGNGQHLIVGGENSMVSVWDVKGNALRNSLNVANAQACYALAFAQDENSFFSCHSDGNIYNWSLGSNKPIRSFKGHSDGVSCVEISPDGTKLLTGSLDNTIKVWDIGTSKELASYNFPSQIFALGICPGESWIAVGLESSYIEVMNLMNSNCKYQLHLHENSVLSLKYANSGKWFVSTGKDRILNSWRSPVGSSLFQCRENNSILCCDISSDDNFLVTGSGEKHATVYQVMYY